MVRNIYGIDINFSIELHPVLKLLFLYLMILMDSKHLIYYVLYNNNNNM